MKITITNFNVDWKLIKNLCRQTVNMKDSNVEPNQEWKRKLLVARHSPLRTSQILVKLEDIPSFVHTHLVRHSVGVTPYVGTSREDRTGVKREERHQTDPVNMSMTMNIESLINISEKRLCNCADKETIKTWKEVLEKIKEYDKDVYWANVPQCVRCGGCPEYFSNCKFYENLMKDISLEEQQDLMKRYDIYNKHREKVKEKSK